MAAGHRAVIFSQFTLVLDVLEDYLQMKGVKVSVAFTKFQVQRIVSGERVAV